MEKWKEELMKHVFTEEQRARGASMGGVRTVEKHGAEYMKEIGRRGGKKLRRRIKGHAAHLIIIDDPIKDGAP
jgi:general stress protein YciG